MYKIILLSLLFISCKSSSQKNIKTSFLLKRGDESWCVEFYHKQNSLTKQTLELYRDAQRNDDTKDLILENNSLEKPVQFSYKNSDSCNKNLYSHKCVIEKEKDLITTFYFKGNRNNEFKVKCNEMKSSY